MKNLKMFAVGLAAMATMTMGVHATGSEYPNGGCKGNACVASITNDSTYKYADFATALYEAKSGDTVKLLTNVTSGNLGGLITSANTIDKNVTIDLNSYSLDLGSNLITIQDKSTLTIVGTAKTEKVTSSQTPAFKVEKGGSLVTKGAITIENKTSNLFRVEGGKVEINDGATLNVPANHYVVVLAGEGTDVSLNAKVGTKTARLAGSLFYTTNVNEDTTAKVTFAGGEYYVSNVLDVVKGLTAEVNDGTIDASDYAFDVTGGKLTINKGTITSVQQAVKLHSGDLAIVGGSLKSTAKAAVYTGGADKGTLTISGGTIASDKFSPLYIENGAVTYKIGCATFEGPKNTAGIYIKDGLLTALDEDGDADNFKGIVTGGKYLYSIIGGTQDSRKISSADVTKYVVAEGIEIKEEGNYKVVGSCEAPATNPEQTPGSDVNPGSEGETQNPTDEKTPQTGDSIMTFMGLGLASIAVVGLGAKNLKKQTN